MGDMYVGIDIGGTKTLVASLDEHGVISQKIRFTTCKDYDDQLKGVEIALAAMHHKDFRAGGVGIPATQIDRKHGRGLTFGNLPWKNVSIDHDMERLTKCPMVMENDAKMAALSEAMLLKHEFSRVLYLTVSTGIGIGWVVDQHIETSIGDGGGRTMLVEHHGKLTPWEEFASGSAIVRRYGKMAKDIDDVATWKIISHDLAKGMVELIALLQPEVIVIGGSVGTHFAKYAVHLRAALKAYETPMMPIPELRAAGRPEEAVLYGCYDLAKEVFSKEAASAIPR